MESLLISIQPDSFSFNVQKSLNFIKFTHKFDGIVLRCFFSKDNFKIFIRHFN